MLFKKIHEKHKPAKPNASALMQDYSEKYLNVAKINNVNEIFFKKNETVLRYKVPLIWSERQGQWLYLLSLYEY